MNLKKVSFSLPSLKTLVNSSNACVYCIENCHQNLTVLPIHLSNIKRSVNQLLSDKVTTYDAVLRGIILGHKNIKVINNVQLNDDGNFVLDYVADIYIFKPEIGNLLSGEVNKKSKDHIGVLVHSFFNVSIHRPRNDNECPKNWIGFDVNIGQSVIFEVVKINFSGRLPFIKGKLIEMCDVDFEDKDSGIGGHESMEENTITKDSLEIHEVVKKKKKKKKQKSDDLVNNICEDSLKEQDSVDKYEELNSEQLIDSLLTKGNGELDYCSPEKKKKKKKKKVSSVEDVEAPSTSITSETPKSKKRKFSESFQTAEPSSLNSDTIDEITIPKKKKKKKHSDHKIQQ